MSQIAGGMVVFKLVDFFLERAGQGQKKSFLGASRKKWSGAPFTKIKELEEKKN